MFRRRQVWNCAWPLEMACSTSAVSRLTSASAFSRFCSSKPRSSRSTGVSRFCSRPRSSRASWRSTGSAGTRSAGAFQRAPGLGLGLGPRAPGFAVHSKRWTVRALVRALSAVAGRGKRCATRLSMFSRSGSSVRPRRVPESLRTPRCCPPSPPVNAESGCGSTRNHEEWRTASYSTESIPSVVSPCSTPPSTYHVTMSRSGCCTVPPAAYDTVTM